MTSWGAVSRVVAFVPDLMDRSRLTRLGDVEVVTVATVEALAEEATDEEVHDADEDEERQHVGREPVHVAHHAEVHGR